MNTRKFFIAFFITVFLFPLQVLAYSNQVILGGESVGIHIETPGVMVIGFYPVNGEYLKGNPEIKTGDLITKVNNISITTIDELTNAVEKEIQNNEVELTVLRNNEEIKRRSEATSFAIDKIEEIKGKGFSALPPLGQNTIDEYPDGYIEQNGSSTPYYQEIRVQDYSELEGNEGREAEVIKIVTVKISYKSGNNDENVEISTAISKED